MAAPVLSSVTPTSGPPGTEVALRGSGFDAGAIAGCPWLTTTEVMNETWLKSWIPSTLTGADGTTQTISIFVQNGDETTSGVLSFVVTFGTTTAGGWTTLDLVVGEVPGFKWAPDITADKVAGWIRSVAQQINAAMLRRGLTLSSADWQQPDPVTGVPDPAAVLELINRYGAAARLAAAIGARFSTEKEWTLAKQLRADFEREYKALASGEYDKMFRPGSRTAETDTLAAAGETLDATTGEADPLFTREQEF